MESTTLTIALAILFVIIGVGGSLVYYFARYYIKTDHEDKELLTKKPVEIGLDKPAQVAPVRDADKQKDISKSEAAVGVTAKPKSVEQALTKTRESLWGRITQLSFKKEMQSQLRSELEDILYTSDLGPKTAEELLADILNELSQSELNDSEVVRQTLRKKIAAMLESSNITKNIFEKAKDHIAHNSAPAVWMVVGVNGAGKTTTIGKLASFANSQNLKTLIIAGDTFRAAADSQLRVWAERAGCEIFNPENTKDPSAVVYSGLDMAKSKGVDLVIIDTAGRLHTQDHLMEELKKMKRVMAKLLPTAPNETLLVIDANAGQNALEQARQFHGAVSLSGVVITKMDGSSKGGVAIGVSNELHIPIDFIGIGESVEDLRPFNSAAFVEAII